MNSNAKNNQPISSQIQSRKDEHGMYIRIIGRFDFNLHSDFREIIDVVKTSSSNKCTIDLSAVEDVDSSALGMLLLLRDASGGEKSDVSIINCKPEIKSILNMANFEKVFHIS